MGIVRRKFRVCNGRLKQIEDKFNDGKYYKALFECECGTRKVIIINSVVKGITRSCGCLHKETASSRNVTHGNTVGGRVSGEYTVWDSMLQRCNNPNNTNYPDYGGRGVSVCDRWTVFKYFLEDMGARPSKDHQIDRRENNGNYEPSNCRWATRLTNSRNKRSNRVITYKDESLCCSEWAARYGMLHSCLVSRLNRGWSVEKALTTPIKRTYK